MDVVSYRVVFESWTYEAESNSSGRIGFVLGIPQASIVAGLKFEKALGRGDDGQLDLLKTADHRQDVLVGERYEKLRVMFGRSVGDSVRAIPFS